MCGQGTPHCSALPPVPRSLCLCPALPSVCSGKPHLLQGPEDDRKHEGYAWAQEDGLRDDCEEELGLGGPAGDSQGASIQGLENQEVQKDEGRPWKAEGA